MMWYLEARRKQGAQVREGSKGGRALAQLLQLVRKRCVLRKSYKQSGYDRELGVQGLYAMTQQKSVWVQL